MTVQIYGKFEKQPGETLDYDILLADWFSNRTDSIQSYVVTVPTGITKASDTVSGTTIRVLLSGGTVGEKYKITTTVTTTTGVIKEVDFVVSVKEA